MARAISEWLRTYSRAYFGADDYGAHLTDIAIGLAAVIGHGESRPMTASDIAAYTGIPRATVIRRLNVLAGMGLVAATKDGRRQPVYIAKANNPEVLQEVAKVFAGASKLAADLSKVDQMTLDQ